MNRANQRMQLGWGLLVGFFGAGALHLEGAVVECRTNGFSTVDFASEYRLKTWTSDEGLPQNTVLGLLQSSDGYMWIGTLDGLARFDGLRFARYDQQNTPALHHHHAILCLAEHPSGCLWMGTLAGLAQYSNHVFRFVPLGDQPVPVRSISARRAGGLWLGTDYGPMRFQDGKAVLCTNYPGFNRTSPAQGRGDCRVNSLLEDPGGTLWLGDDRGLVRLPPKAEAFEVVYAEDPQRGQRGSGAGNLLRDEAGGIWFGNAQGLFRHYAGRTEMFPSAANGFTGLLNPLCGGAGSDVWVATTSGGVSLWHEGRFIHYRGPAQLAGERVGSMAVDREGSLWIGTQTGGVSLAQRHKVMNLTTADGLAHDDVWSLCPGADGSVWMATAFGLSRYAQGRFETLFPTPPQIDPQNDSLNAVLLDRTGTVWTGGRLNLWQMRSGKFSGVMARLNGTNYALHVQSLYEDPMGALWVGTTDGLWRYREGAWELYAVRGSTTPGAKPVLPNASVLNVLRDASGATWVGTKGGVCRLRGDMAKCFTERTGFPAEIGGPALADPDGTVWFWSASGLIRFRNGRFFRVSQEHGLLEDLTYNVLEDDEGCLWLNGNRGLQRVRKADVNALAEGKTNWVECVLYGLSEGMASAESNGEVSPNSCKTPDGRLWFPTTKGVVVVNPRALRNPGRAPSVLIEQIVANREVVFGDGAGNSKVTPPVFPEKGLRFRPGQARSLLIHYTASSFTSPERVRFQYKLEGHDPDWTEDNSNLRTAIYTHLRPGTYRFRARACNSSGAQSESEAQFAFSLAPYFYETAPFYVLCAGGLLLAVGTLHHLRLKGARRIQELEQLHALEQERARIAQDMHDSLGADLSRISMLAEMALRQGVSGRLPRLELQRVSGLARSLVGTIGELVWATNPRHNTLESLAAYIREHASELFELTGVQMLFEFPENLPTVSISGETRRHLFIAAKEALNNIARHAQAKQVVLRLAVADGVAELVIRDNGKGFNLKEATQGIGSGHGNGLRNLAERLASLGGKAHVQSEPGAGTTVTLTLPLRGAAGTAAQGRDRAT